MGFNSLINWPVGGIGGKLPVGGIGGMLPVGAMMDVFWGFYLLKMSAAIEYTQDGSAHLGFYWNRGLFSGFCLGYRLGIFRNLSCEEVGILQVKYLLIIAEEQNLPKDPRGAAVACYGAYASTPDHA